MTARLRLAALWWAVACLMVLVFGGLVAGMALLAVHASGSELGEVQRTLWVAIAKAIGLTALAPVGGFALVAWCLAAAVRPGLDGNWRSIRLGLLALCALGFPPVGAWSFTVWSGGTPFDYLATWFLVAGGASAALLLARRILPSLGPGAFSGASGDETHS